MWSTQSPPSLMSQLVLYIKLSHPHSTEGPFLSYRPSFKMARDSAVISLQWYSCRWISERLPPRGWLARRPAVLVGVPVRRGFITSYRSKSTEGPQTTISPPGLSGLPAGHSVAPAHCHAPAHFHSPGLCSHEDRAKLTLKLMPRAVPEWTSPVITHILAAKQWNYSLWNDHQHVSVYKSFLLLFSGGITDIICFSKFWKSAFGRVCNSEIHLSSS